MSEIIYQKYGKFDYWREILELSDGGEIALDWIRNPNSPDRPKARNIILVFPGISGDSRNYYCVNAQWACVAKGFDMVVVNWRGMAGVPLKVSINPQVHVFCLIFAF